MDDILIKDGGEIKALGGGKFAGYLIRFTSADSADLVGDYFTKSTELFLEDGQVLPVLYDHGLDPKLKSRKIGRAIAQRDDVGLWIEGQLFLRDEYEKAIYERLVKKNKAGLSSGAAQHLVERKAVKGAKEILSWCPAEASITPRPCEPRNEVVALKSYAEDPEHKDFDSFFEGEESTPSQLTFQQHSETVVTAVEEHANEVGALAGEVKAFLGRVRQRLDFRTNDPLKAGRTISKPNRERLAATRGRLVELRETLSGIEADLAELLAQAEPKGGEESAFTMQPAGVEKSLSPDELQSAALSAVADFEALRFQLTVDPSRR